MSTYTVTDERPTAFRTLAQMIAYFDPFQANRAITLRNTAACIEFRRKLQTAYAR